MGHHGRVVIGNRIIKRQPVANGAATITSLSIIDFTLLLGAVPLKMD